MTIHDRIKSALAGEIEPDELGPHWRHDLAMPIYQTACKLLETESDEKRKRLASRLPPRILELCRAEAKRLLQYRKQ